MKNLQQYGFMYLAALFTLAEMILAQVVDGRIIPSARYLAPIFGAISLCLIFWPMFTLQQQGRAQPGGDYMQATILVDSGLFAVVRHPQYLGYMCLNVTFVLITQHWLILLLGSLAITLFYLYALQEENRLLEKFGRAYQAYMGRVPRFNAILGVARLMWRR